MKYLFIVLTITLTQNLYAKDKSEAKRAPAEEGSFICYDQHVSNSSKNFSLNSYCDPSKAFTITHIAGGPNLVVCCVQK